MTDSRYDVIVVGAGHNGLVCATYLAKAGRKVLVVESNQQVGGAAVTEEFSPGFSVSRCAQWLMLLNPDISKNLNLKRYGLKLAAENLKTIALDKAGKNITLSSKGVFGESISLEDNKAYQSFNTQINKFSKILSKAFKRRPPKLVERNLTDNLNLIKLAIDIKLLGKTDMEDFMRMALMNIYDVMEEHFDNEQLKAAISLDAILGTAMGPRSPNSLFSYLYRQIAVVYGFQGPAVVEGGMGAVTKALASAAKNAGVVIRCDAKVETINIESAQTTAVTLKSGDCIKAQIVVSSADPKTTFEKLVGFPNIETGVARDVHNIRMKGCAAKLHLALDGLPTFNGVDTEELGNRLIISPTMNYIERAFNHVKYGEYSKQPAIDISIPTVYDKTLAPEGKHVLTAIVQFAPYDLKQGWYDDTKELFKQAIIDCIAEYSPDIHSLILDSELLTPVDIEQKFNLGGGHWHQGELSLDQVMMMRPFPSASQYRTSVDGLYLCGAGSHPGGGVMGLAGFNAAKEIIKGGDKS